jgi:hypothetical protein
LAIDIFYCLLGVANIGPCRSRRMQGLPPEEPEEYAPLLPNSPEGPSPEGAVNNDASSEIGSSTPLVEPSLPVNPLLNVPQDPVFLRINSSGDVVVEDYPRIPSGPFVESGVDEPPFPSEAFRTPVQTSGIFNPSSIPVRSLWRTPSGRDIFDKLGMSPNQPTSPHVLLLLLLIQYLQIILLARQVIFLWFQTHCWLVHIQFFLASSLALPQSHKLHLFLSEVR